MIKRWYISQETGEVVCGRISVLKVILEDLVRFHSLNLNWKLEDVYKGKDDDRILVRTTIFFSPVGSKVYYKKPYVTEDAMKESDFYSYMVREKCIYDEEQDIYYAPDNHAEYAIVG